VQHDRLLHRERRLMRSRSLLLAVGILVALIAPAPAAHAHAALVSSDPSDGASLPAAPGMVRLTFSEPVTPIGAGLRVVDSDGTRVDLGPSPTHAGRPEGASVLAVTLPGDLADGGYLVVWRVRSVDGHAVAGTLRFSIGDGAALSDALIDTLAAADAPGSVQALDRIVRGALLLLLLLAAGTAASAVFVVRTESEHRSATRLMRTTAVMALPLVPAAVWLQGAVQAGSKRASLVLDALGSGTTAPGGLSRGVGLLLVLAVASRRPRPVTHLVTAALTLLPLAWEGHQRSVGAPLLPLVDAVHLIGAALWLSAVVLLAANVRSTITERIDALRSLARRVARLATASLAAVTVAGIAQARALVSDLAGLTGTAYGRVLMAKVALIALAVIAASIARRRAHRRADGWSAVLGLLRTEVALIAGAVLLTGTLVTLPPPAVSASPPLFTTSAPLSDSLLLDLGVDTSRPGRTELHLYIVESDPASDGGRVALTTRALDVRVALTSVPDGIGPILVGPALLEPGHWFAALEPLPPGMWELEVIVGLDRFTERSVRVLVPIP